ncbi:MAG: EF-hand domain-containing protein [Gemmatimonadota bacterium]
MMRVLALLAAAAMVTGCATAAGELAFPAVDADDDGQVSRMEFEGFLGDMNAFDRYDDNNDGELSLEEYREAVTAGIEGEAYFRGFDQDRSGGLSRAEFISGIFSTYDRNGDGWLNEEEFEGAVTGLSLEL